MTEEYYIKRTIIHHKSINFSALMIYDLLFLFYFKRINQILPIECPNRTHVVNIPTTLSIVFLFFVFYLPW